MPRCEVCDNDYDTPMEITLEGGTHVFDCFECAIHALAPTCERCGCRVLGHGIGELSGKAFRIAHMGHVNAPMVLGTLAVVEMALGALGIPHRKGGVAAAIDWLAEKVKA